MVGRRVLGRGLAGLALAMVAGTLIWPVGATGDPSPRREVLFNGRDFSGWYTFVPEHGKNNDPLKIFRVEDGTIAVSGQKFGYLSTEKEYSNFRLSVDFKWGTKKWPPRENEVRDAGVLYHCTGPDLVWANCLELQVQERDTGDLWIIPGTTNAPSVQVLGKTLGGDKNYTRGVKWADYEKPNGEWNTVQVVARGDRFEHWVNGRLNMRGSKSSVTRGKIQLQSEGAELWYRNVVLEHLD